jgi:hypothetical protein
MSQFNNLNLYDDRMQQKAFDDEALLSDNYSDMKLPDFTKINNYQLGDKTSFDKYLLQEMENFKANQGITDLDEEAVEAYNNYRENTPAIINPISFEEFVEVTGKN